jgi:hypothetical protein
MIDWSVPENGHEGKCIFVGTPDMLLKKFAPEQIDTGDDYDCSEHGCLNDHNFQPFPGECCNNTN